MQTEASRSKVIAVITFFAGLFVLLLLSLFFTGGLEGVIGKEEQIHVAFHESVTGLRKGSPVTLSGVSVGRVQFIRPMTSDTAQEIVRSASVIRQPRIRRPGKPGQITSGTSFLKQEHPLVLVTVKVQSQSIPLNKHTHASLITTDFTASQSVRFSVGKRKHHPQLEGKSVVVSAEQSPLSRFRSKFMNEENGVLREKNIKGINDLIRNLKEVSKQLATLTGKQNKQRIDELIASHRQVAAQLKGWVRDEFQCPNHDVSVEVEKFEEDGTTKYRYRCPESGKEWVRDHPPRKGRLTRTVDRLDEVLVRLNDLLGPQKDQPSIPVLVQQVQDLTGQVDGTARSMESMINENRSRIQEVLNEVNRLSHTLQRLITELDQDPSRAVFGRRGPEIRSPYTRGGN